MLDFRFHPAGIFAIAGNILISDVGYNFLYHTTNLRQKTACPPTGGGWGPSTSVTLT